MFRTFALSATIAALAFATTLRAADSPETEKLSCAAPVASDAEDTNGRGAASATKQQPAAIAGPKVLFKLNRAEDAPAILRFVTNYLAVEPTAKVAVVGYGDGIDFMLQGASDASGRLYAEQMASLAARGVEFKVCNNTLKARNLTAAAVGSPATVVPGAVNEIIRLQTKEGYAYFQN